MDDRQKAFYIASMSVRSDAQDKAMKNAKRKAVR